jgi:hypothetical protein
MVLAVQAEIRLDLRALNGAPRRYISLRTKKPKGSLDV